MAGSPDKVYYVSEQSMSIRIKSVQIAKESERAFMLHDTFVAAPLNRPKRVLMKGVDLIALSEKEALDHYLNQMRQQIIDMELSMVRAQQFIEIAVETRTALLQAKKAITPPLAIEAVAPAPVEEPSGVSIEFVSDHPVDHLFTENI